MELIKIGKIVNTHGIKGELRILSKFPYKEKIFIKNMKLYIDKKDIETINTYRKHKNFDMVTFTGYTNINEVLKYKGKNVYVNKEDITLRKEEYLDEDIIGMTVIYNNIEKGIVSDHDNGNQQKKNRNKQKQLEQQQSSAAAMRSNPSALFHASPSILRTHIF